MKQPRKITMLWKFFYWPVVWSLVFVPALVWPESLSGIFRIAAVLAGSILLVLSLLLTSAGGRTLARTGHSEEHKTIWPDRFTEFGIFSCMRHPMHLGLALFPLSVALISGSVAAICSSGWGVSGALWFVLYIEEKDALQKFASTYSDYMQRVPPFAFKAECLKKAFLIWQDKNAATNDNDS